MAVSNHSYMYREAVANTPPPSSASSEEGEFYFKVQEKYLDEKNRVFELKSAELPTNHSSKKIKEAYDRTNQQHRPS